MRRPITLAFLAVTGLGLAGCQYSFPVKAVRHGESYVLQAEGGSGRFAPKACIRTLAVKRAGETIWEIHNPRNGWDGACDKDFPLVYGEAPKGFETVVAARPLAPGMLYTIEGAGVARLHGAFAIKADLKVVNGKRARARPSG